MHSIKGFFYTITGSLLRFAIFLTITVNVLLFIVAEPATIKSILKKSQVYDRFVASVIEDNKKNNITTDGASLSDPAVAKILTESFPANDLQQKSELFIDSIYAWLNSQDTFTFSIDFSENKAAFAYKLTDYAFTKMASQPPCLSVVTEIDPITAVCRPSNIDITSAKQTYFEQIMSNESFLQKTVFTEKDLPKNSKGQTIVEQLSYAPQVFSWLKGAPYILGVLCLFLAVDVLLLSSRKRHAVRGIAKILIGSGVSIVVFPIIYSYVIPYFARSLAFTGEAVGTQKLLSELTREISSRIDFLFIVSGGVVATVGVVMLIIERLSRPVTKYTRLEQKSGVAVAAPSPKQLQGKLTQQNVPLQTSDGPRKKTTKATAAYRTLKSKRDF